MSSKEKSDVHHPGPESDVPKPSEGPQTEEESRTLAETHKGGSEQEAKGDKHDSNSDAGSHAPEDESADDSNADADAYWNPQRKKSLEPASAPCTCRCGGCCCHGASSNPQHCVRCHADYTFNHSQACSVPHAFNFDDLEDSDHYPRDFIVRSICCGSDLCGVESVKDGWSQPAPCFMGWHTTDVDAVKEQYNGLNVLRCDLGPRGKCRRTRMKHHAHYEHLYDNKVKYIEEDCEDQENYLKRKREEIGDEDHFDSQFGYVDADLIRLSANERRRRREY